jgi:hypothetical protein
MPNIILVGFCKELVIFMPMQLNKNIKNFLNYFLGPLLFIWLVYAIYRQINNQPHLDQWWSTIKQSLQSSKLAYLIIAVLLVPVNWGIEAAKWRLSINPVFPISFLKAFRAVLSGVSFSVSMPNRIGEYLGRIIYLPDGNRLKTISVTLMGSISQLLITLTVGTIGFVYLEKYLIGAGMVNAIWYRFILVGLIIVVLILTLFYFQISSLERLMEKWFPKKYLYLVQSLHWFDKSLLGKLLLLSLLRYAVFVTQYILLFTLFEVQVPLDQQLHAMGLIFLALAVIPSIALVEVVLRGEISLTLMGLFSTNSLGIGLTSVTVWLINLIFPAIIGSLLILNVKVFKRNETT